MSEQEETFEAEQRAREPETLTESIRLTKNSKGINWEIKLLSLDIGKLEILNNQMIEKFGKFEVEEKKGGVKKKK